MHLNNVLIYLIGYPGVGKLTTAKALCSIAGMTLVDNHLANTPIFKIIGADGVTPIPEAAWDRVERVRDILFDTILHVAPRHTSFVLTNVLLDGRGDRTLFNRVKELAEERSSLFVPVILNCEEEVLCRRIVSPGRVENMKLTKISSVIKLMQEQPLLSIVHPNLLVLDNTRLAAESSAASILEHIQSR